MAITHSRARLWASATDYFDFDFCNVRVLDSQPDAIDADRLGLDFITEPTDTHEKQQWARGIELTFPSRLIHSLNVASGGSTERRLAAWLRYHVREAKTTFYLYVLTTGTDDEGTAFTEKHYYVLAHPRPLPPWILGNRTGLGGIERYITLEFTVIEVSNSAEGTFTDYDVSPLTGGNLTVRTGRPG